MQKSENSYSVQFELTEILISNTKKQLIQLELKELIAPSITSVATNTIPDQASRMNTSLRMDQGTSFSHYYNVFNIRGIDMLLRPKFTGNIGVTLSDSTDKSNTEIINYEAYVLGCLHASTVNLKNYSNALDSISADHWEEDISSMTDHFNEKFIELKK